MSNVAWGTVADRAVELEINKQMPFMAKDAEGKVASSRFSIHYTTFYMVHVIF